MPTAGTAIQIVVAKVRVPNREAFELKQLNKLADRVAAGKAKIRYSPSDVLR